jgi:hypothetical protein
LRFSRRISLWLLVGVGKLEKASQPQGLLLNYALANSGFYIGVVGPSWRQTKLVIRRIGEFARRLPPGSKIIVQKTRITCRMDPLLKPSQIILILSEDLRLHCVYADEFNFIPNAEDLYDAALFTLGTTNGKFICTSTPWNTDSLFYRICNSKDFEDFARHHVTWERAQEPNGPLKMGILEKIKKQCVTILPGGVVRWRRSGLKMKTSGSLKA